MGQRYRRRRRPDSRYFDHRCAQPGRSANRQSINVDQIEDAVDRGGNAAPDRYRELDEPHQLLRPWRQDSILSRLERPMVLAARYARLLRAHGKGFRRHGASARESSRLYLVPGMGHCSSGAATLDQFDLLGAVVDWVEQGKGLLGDRDRSGFSRPQSATLRLSPTCAVQGSGQSGRRRQFRMPTVR